MLFKITYITHYPGSIKEKFYVRAHNFDCAKNAIECLLMETREDGNDWDILSIERVENYVDWIEFEEEEETDEEGDIHSEFEQVTCPKCETINDIPKGMKVTNCTHCKERFVVDGGEKEQNKEDNKDENNGDPLPTDGG